MKKVLVNEGQCEKVGKVIKTLKLRSSFYEREFLIFQSDRETKLRAYLYSVAICHQTHPLINRRLNLKGWDYLEKVFLDLAQENSQLLNPGVLMEMSLDALVELLKPLFAEDGNPEHCTMDRLEERARFLQDIDVFLEKNFDGSADRMLRSSQGYILHDGSGLYEILDKMEAYSDPSKKKSTFFIKLLIDSGLSTIKDPENFIPVMDYHMQRVFLRMGCVEVLDEKLGDQLREKKQIASDTEIREACIEAVQIISQSSGYEIIQMNDFFWPLGRSCCRETTLCADKVCVKKPCTFELMIDIPSHKKCLFEGICAGYKNAEYRKYWQPIVDTHYY